MLLFSWKIPLGPHTLFQKPKPTNPFMSKNYLPIGIKPSAKHILTLVWDENSKWLFIFFPLSFLVERKWSKERRSREKHLPWETLSRWRTPPMAATACIVSAIANTSPLRRNASGFIDVLFDGGTLVKEPFSFGRRGGTTVLIANGKEKLALRPRNHIRRISHMGQGHHEGGKRATRHDANISQRGKSFAIFPRCLISWQISFC